MESVTNPNSNGQSANGTSGLPSLASLRLSQDFGTALGVKKVVTTVRVRKPTAYEFVRVRAGESWRLEMWAFEDKVNRETYLVDASFHSELAGNVRPMCLFVTVNRQGDLWLWPVRLPGLDGRPNSWHESAIEAARRAEVRWVRIAANMSAGMYDVFEAAVTLSEPVWPELTLEQIYELAFKDRFINRADHPVLRSLRGEV